jgi:D-alanine-D-alanine ligase
MGGWSAEREVSLVTGAAVAKALHDNGYNVTAIDVQRDMGTLLTRLYPKPDVVFNALHGRFGEDGCVQGFLDILNIPYTHSGLLASALAMDKVMAKHIFQMSGISVAKHVIATSEEIRNSHVMEPPYVIKPSNEGSSVGVHIVNSGDNKKRFSEPGWPFGGAIMVEKYIAGREFTTAVLGDKPLAVTEIITDHAFYDYDAKYVGGGSKHLIPADIDANLYDEIMRLALLAHQSLGCRGVTRADFRYDGKEIYILEVNTQPGLTSTSLVPEQAAHVDMSFNQLITWMVDNAECDA